MFTGVKRCVTSDLDVNVGKVRLCFLFAEKTQGESNFARTINTITSFTVAHAGHPENADLQCVALYLKLTGLSHLFRFHT